MNIFELIMLIIGLSGLAFIFVMMVIGIIKGRTNPKGNPPITPNRGDK